MSYENSLMRQVILYTRPGCHLCDDARQAMKAADCDNEYTLQEINIESERELLRRYQYDIPVITLDGVEAFRHRLTAEEFRERLRSGAGKGGVPGGAAPTGC